MCREKITSQKHFYYFIYFCTPTFSKHLLVQTSRKTREMVADVENKKNIQLQDLYQEAYDSVPSRCVIWLSRFPFQLYIIYDIKPDDCG